MVKLPLSIWCVREPQSAAMQLDAVEPWVEQLRFGPGNALQAHLADGVLLPDVALIERWDPGCSQRRWTTCPGSGSTRSRPRTTRSSRRIRSTVQDLLDSPGDCGQPRPRAADPRRAAFGATTQNWPRRGNRCPTSTILRCTSRRAGASTGPSLIGVETLLRWNGMPVPTLARRSAGGGGRTTRRHAPTR